MEKKYYSAERSVQLLISLLKQHNIRKVVASPGATNITFVGSLQNDPYFEIYSSVDERSAAYIACGLAAESGEPVVLTCTGATASRNYVSGLTEAYYRKLPILAVTSTQDINRIGHLIPQVIDRQVIQNDIALLSEYISATTDKNTEWANTVKINRALLELKHRGGGPVHINLVTDYSRDFSIKELPEAHKINRCCLGDEFPSIPEGRVAIFIGSHSKFSKQEVALIDAFCESHNAVVFCDHTSGYNGRFKVLVALLAAQELYVPKECSMDLLIHIGEVSGAYIGLRPRNVWRVNPDGEIRDHYRALSWVFEMSELDFFAHYKNDCASKNGYFEQCTSILDHCRNLIPENLPFSNVWVAQQISKRIPDNSVLHLGILNTLRTWNLFEISNQVFTYCNTGGFGIDGCCSSLIGASLVNPNQLYFGVVGDLAFFYDMNAIGNRHVGNNVRILLINNGRGTEFRNYFHNGADFGSDADKFIAAAGHYGNQSHNLVKHYAEDLGYEYMTSNNKEEFLSVAERFVVPQITEKPMLFEVFTNSEDESNAIKIMYNLLQDSNIILKQKVKSVLGEKGTSIIKKILK